MERTKPHNFCESRVACDGLEIAAPNRVCCHCKEKMERRARIAKEAARFDKLMRDALIPERDDRKFFGWRAPRPVKIGAW